ncbi:MAG: hypothetical protein N4A72_18210 [Bacteroidales bacterium]|jgi:hypothetical protein|nr:hypothetical protein [Bacteroidales bacterium]
MKKILILTSLALMSVLFTNTANAQENSNNINKIGVSTSSILNTAVDYRIGGKSFYGLAQIGFNYKEMDAPVISLGAGYSAIVSDKLSINSELAFIGYFYDNLNEDMIDKGFKTNLLLEFPLTSKLLLMTGPNLSIIEENSGNSSDTKSLLNPLTTFNFGDTDVNMFVGFSLGISYQF